MSAREQLENRAEKAAQDLLDVSRQTAFERLRIGALRGTLAEAVLTPLFDLLGMK